MRTRNEIAMEVFELEALAIKRLERILDASFNLAVDLILKTKGKVIVSGIGKSGIIARKMASTLSSTGTPALFLHPAESSHGDLGVVSSEDLIVGISYGGESSEMLSLLKFASRKGIPLIALTGKLDSTLAQHAEVSLDVSVEKEACPMNLAPTASSTATLALCDALAMVVLYEKGFKEESFAEYHPGGSLGRRLLTRVSDLMHGKEHVPLVTRDANFEQILALMTDQNVRGVCGVLDESEDLAGVITDGDLRRWMKQAFAKGEFPRDTVAESLMSSDPKCIEKEALAQNALFVMEDQSISSLFVVESKNDRKPVGLIHLKDLLDAKIT